MSKNNKKVDNSIHIGDCNKIKNSTIGNNSNNRTNDDSEKKWYEKPLGQIIIGVLVTVIGGALLYYLEMN
jgi:hypothetical protein